MRSVVELRAEARRLREMIENLADPALKQELAARALDLSIRAEEIARLHEAPEILRMNISRYRSMLAAGIDDDQKEAHCPGDAARCGGDARPSDRKALIITRKSQQEDGPLPSPRLRLIRRTIDDDPVACRQNR